MNNANIFTELFPKVVTSNNTPEQQMYRVLDELVEVEESMLVGDKEHAMEELLDVMIASANTIYKLGYTQQDIYDKLNFVNDKNRRRGYYGKEK